MIFLLIVGCHAKGEGFGKIVSLHLLLTLMCPLYPLCGLALGLVLRSFSETVVPYVVVDLVCPWEDVSSGFPVPPT